MKGSYQVTQKGPSGLFCSFYSSQNLRVFYNWLSGSQECILVLHWCPKPCIPPNSSSLCAAAWHLLSISPAVWAGWGSGFPVGPCTASGILQAVWSRSWASSSCSSGCTCCPRSVTPALPLPAFVAAEQLFGQRLLLTTVIQWCGNGDLGSGSSPGYLSAC